MYADRGLIIQFLNKLFLIIWESSKIEHVEMRVSVFEVFKFWNVGTYKVLKSQKIETFKFSKFRNLAT